ncbi:hypothetical protein LOK49_LG03G01608 [Camellia lanceoleosa]|uniref:Uncharacterized protein n=1 Tax=Camellia lanceoleosa TaxID=1840588 RepID=A0ACC0IF06_9ERIC|nr:hypothetical protein LOK49_LG03G01608 [Camellia lanceoleosa]
MTPRTTSSTRVAPSLPSNIPLQAPGSWRYYFPKPKKSPNPKTAFSHSQLLLSPQLGGVGSPQSSSPPPMRVEF